MGDWTAKQSIQGIMELLGVMQNSCRQYDDAKIIVVAAVKSEKDLFLLYQKPEVSNTDYLRCFKALVYVFHSGG